ncbi:MAG: aminotransferase class I/II-fold pyridoxal phosphate-dependent enzyme, partial [Steroidobacteraceae bacterium]
MSQIADPSKPSPATKVPLLDLRRQYQSLAAEVIPVLEKICDSQQFVLGRYVTQFEQAAAAYCGCRHAVGVSSGTDALLLALMALGIGTGDEVITSPFTFFATAGTIARTGARPLFCDIEADSFNIDPAAVRVLLERDAERRGSELINRRSGGRIRALMPVHLYG